MNSCRICRNSENNEIYNLTERHFGFYDTFQYIKCNSCGCLQIGEYPSNIAKYYPAEYNAFDTQIIKNQNKLIAFLKKKKTLHCLNEQKNVIGYFSSKLLGPGFVDRLRRGGVSLSDSILDVGCGTGHRLNWLHDKGFRNLTGTDIFIKNNIHYKNGVSIFKKDISEVNRKYDFIMLNHSFEHMPHQLDVLKHLFRIIKPGKILLIRIPTFSNYMWETYGDHWIGLEPPRHFYLHTISSMKTLISQTEFFLKEFLFESNIYQFIGSEQYKQGITRRAKDSYFENPKNSKFHRNDIKKFLVKAKELDSNYDGFSACFYLKKPL